jgi:uncharacterized Fe-S cluster protein YjdI
MDNSKLFDLELSPELLDAHGYKKYAGKELDIYYNKEVCQHAAFCVRGSSGVYEVGRRPWIMADNENRERNIEIIQTCPSGALKFISKNKM